MPDWFYLGTPLETADYQRHPDGTEVVVGRVDGEAVSFEANPRGVEMPIQPRRVGHA